MTNDEWCDFCDMPRNQCQHSAPAPEPVEKPYLGTIVVAKKRTRCPVCDEMILVGDHIGPVLSGDGDEQEQEFTEWAHYGCGR